MKCGHGSSVREQRRDLVEVSLMAVDTNYRVCTEDHPTPPVGV
jgi:hypothetical protein